ncbi:MAG: hypothetical protein HYR66_13275 [Sphingobacteriales bacterium]|nr:hypothetical protein [Sphingobacteriales bacterium]MBI3720781.1 hypothetical protein [Sphingobacteriales bacterium]
MKTILLILFLIFKMSLLFATGDDAAPPVDTLSGKNEVKSLPKVCSCELIKVVNNDSKIETVAILAEKTTNGKTKLDYKITAFELWKEKKYLTTVFVNDMKVIDKVQETTPCKSLYAKLKEKYKELKLQSIIDVDSRGLVVR